jgi:F-type H+-transporting ATPase subunit delta
MIEDVLAERYAKALAGIARERDLVERIAQEVTLLADILTPGAGEINLPELGVLLGMPRIPLEKKIHITDVMLEKLNVSVEVGNLLNVLIQKRRIHLVPRIAQRYNHRVAELKNQSEVRIEAAMSLAEDDLQRLRETLRECLGREVEMHMNINKDLLGGLRLSVDGKLLDRSVEGALESLEKRLR